ncbi:MAG TPA: ABC transporter permease subunit [Pirellulales bacterium]|jgi:iron(III) transport system permease protein
MIRVSSRFGWILATLAAVGLTATLWPDADRTWGLVANTARLVSITCAISIPLGTALAFLITRTDLPGRRVMFVALAWLLFVPLYVQTGAWQAGFGQQGWQTLFGFGKPWLVGWQGAIWVHAAAAIPWVAILVGFGLRATPPEYEEQALLDASPARVFFYVTLRQSTPLLVTAALWVAVTTAGEIAVTDQFQNRTYAEELYTQVAMGATAGEVTVQALPGAALTAWLVLAALALVGRAAPRDRQSSPRPSLVFPLGLARWPAFALVMLFFALLVGLPLANLLWKCGVLVELSPEGRVRHWSLWKCARIIATSPYRYRVETLDSLRIGATAATASLFVGGCLAWRARSSRAATALLLALSAVCLAIPGPIIGLGVISLLNQPNLEWAQHLYDRTIAPPALAQFVRAFPPVALVLWYALASIPDEQTEAAALDGAGAMQTLLRVIAPQRWRMLLAAWLIGLAVAVSDLGATILTTPPGIEPLSVRVSGLLHFGVEDQVAGICLSLGFCLAAVGFAATALIRRARPDR